MLRSSIIVLSSAALGLAELYCPTKDDFQIDGGYWNGRGGWTMRGNGGVHGRQTFDLLGGYVEFDYDTTSAHTGVNNNFYLVSPEPGYFSATNDCDIQAQGKPACMEMDIIEMNGNCLAQTTWHTWPNHNGDCDQAGCWGQRYRKGRSHIKAEFSSDGWMTVYIDGAKVEVTNPVPSGSAHSYVRSTMARLGGQIQSSQWVGWVPSGNCGGSGPLDSSAFSIENLRISGRVVQGREPPRCSGPSPSPSPTPSPSPSPSTCPSQGTCGCSWSHGGSNCATDDGSECWCRCCCGYTAGKTCRWHGLLDDSAEPLVMANLTESIVAVI